AIFALLIPVIILGGIYSGIFTATEAAVVAVAYAIIIGILIYKKLTWNIFYNATRSSILTTSFIMITFVFANIFARILTIERIPTLLSNWVTGLFPSNWMIMLSIIVFLLIVG